LRKKHLTKVFFEVNEGKTQRPNPKKNMGDRALYRS